MCLHGECKAGYLVLSKAATCLVEDTDCAVRFGVCHHCFCIWLWHGRAAFSITQYSTTMKYSIHIGINRYKQSMYGNADLRQCVNDAETMCAIAGQRGFSPLMITDEDGTKAEIVNTLKEYAEKLVPGDILLFTQSSHGTYMDTAGGRSTALCCHDDVLWDFESAPIWKLFKKGVLIIRLVDCCFAESNFRMVKHGNAYLKERFVKLLQKVNIKPTISSLRGCVCSIISISSSNVLEVSYENEDGGVFTQAVDFALTLKPDTPLTYKKMHASAQKYIRAAGFPQTPKIETVNAGTHAVMASFGE